MEITMDEFETFAIDRLIGATHPHAVTTTTPPSHHTTLCYHHSGPHHTTAPHHTATNTAATATTLAMGGTALATSLRLSLTHTSPEYITLRTRCVACTVKHSPAKIRAISHKFVHACT